MAAENGDFEFRGLNHLALVCSDMARTVDFYSNVLGMALGCSGVVNKDAGEKGVAGEMHDGVFVRSVYFQDPDGILLEFAAWIRRPAPEPPQAQPQSPPVSRSFSVVRTTSNWRETER